MSFHRITCIPSHNNAIPVSFYHPVELSECFLGDGRTYRGLQNVTKSGSLCHYWTITSSERQAAVNDFFPMILLNYLYSR